MNTIEYETPVQGQLLYYQDHEGLDGSYTNAARELTQTMWGYDPENIEHTKQVSQQLYQHPLDRKWDFQNGPHGRIATFKQIQLIRVNKCNSPLKTKSTRAKEQIRQLLF